MNITEDLIEKSEVSNSIEHELRITKGIQNAFFFKHIIYYYFFQMSFKKSLNQSLVYVNSTQSLKEEKEF